MGAWQGALHLDERKAHAILQPALAFTFTTPRFD